MPDIIITTPKSEIANAAKEAADCLNLGGGFYFRSMTVKPNIIPGDKVFYTENGYIRGFAVAERIESISSNSTIGGAVRCHTTGIDWPIRPGGCVIIMRADSWKWLKPSPYMGFVGFRYFDGSKLEVIGGWRMPKPVVESLLMTPRCR